MGPHILKLLIQNDPATQKAVYYQHADRLMAIVLRYVFSITDAEDVLQDSFVQIFKKVKTFDQDKGSFESWTAKIAINYALMTLRKKKKLVFYEHDLHDPIIQTSNEAVQHLQSEDVEKFIQKLDDKYAIIFKLKALEGFSHQEIAGLLGIRKEASRTIFSRARKQLKHMLKSDDTNLFTSSKEIL